MGVSSLFQEPRPQSRIFKKKFQPRHMVAKASGFNYSLKGDVCSIAAHCSLQRNVLICAILSCRTSGAHCVSVCFKEADREHRSQGQPCRSLIYT